MNLLLPSLCKQRLGPGCVRSSQPLPLPGLETLTSVFSPEPRVQTSTHHLSLGLALPVCQMTART